MNHASRTIPIFISSVALLLGVGIERVLAQQDSVQLFEARPTFGTGPVTSPVEARPFAGTLLGLNFALGDTTVISSTPDGTGPIVIDNFMTINGVNVCEGVPGQLGPESCFGPFIEPDLPTGVPIETVLTPIPPIDVSEFIPVGETTVLFDLSDFGVIAGNSNLFLVTTGAIRPVFAGLVHRPLGAAQLSPLDSGLLVSNVGSSGEDGVSLSSLGANVHVIHELPPTRPIGAFLKATAKGTVNGIPDQRLFTSVEEEVANGMQVTPDFSGIGARTYELQLFNRGTLVFRRTGMTGPAFIMPSLSLRDSCYHCNEVNQCTHSHPRGGQGKRTTIKIKGLQLKCHITFIL